MPFGTLLRYFDTITPCAVTLRRLDHGILKERLSMQRGILFMT
jgi:hypothetical protein